MVVTRKIVSANKLLLKRSFKTSHRRGRSCDALEYDECKFVHLRENVANTSSVEQGFKSDVLMKKANCACYMHS